ncbi:RNA polymerase sigma factor [Brevibacillus borstelensis]
MIEAKEEQTDAALVEKARNGDREAFGELVRRHRAKVYGYARSFTKEPFLAEDIVQDALIRAFLHLGTLVDSRRFLPWLHRIVRNQAYTRLKAGPQTREQVFSTWHSPAEEEPETDWQNLEGILYRLGQQHVHSLREQISTPEEALMRRELLETITKMLRCLNPKERQIVESHFFDHLSPQEIARLFRMSQANVYQVLSRSRKKLVREKIRLAVGQYVLNRKDEGFMNKVTLKKPEAFSQHVWTTAAAAMYGLTEYTERRFSLPMVMGLTGHAFRINVVPGEIHIAGPTMFDFGSVLSEGMRNLGFEVKVVQQHSQTAPGPNGNQADPSLLTAAAREQRKLPEMLPEALSLIHDAIDRGHAVLSWDLFIPEFGLIYGYDTETRQFQAGDNCGHDQSISYEHLGRGLVEELFVLAIDKQVAVDQKTMLASALRTILHHYRQETSGPSCAHGLAAYDAWREAYRQKGIEPNGNAYTTTVAKDARRYASLFWKEIAETWTDAQFDGIRPHIEEARELYAKIADEYAVLACKFPFPAGGNPNDPDEAEEAVRVLDRISKLEEQAATVLEQMQKKLLA